MSTFKQYSSELNDSNWKLKHETWHRITNNLLRTSRSNKSMEIHLLYHYTVNMLQLHI